MKIKNRLLIAAIFLFVGIIFIFLPFFLTEQKDTQFWISMSIITFSLLLAYLSTDLLTLKRRKGLLGRVSFLSLSYVYFFWTLLCALVFDIIFNLSIKAYVSIHIIVFSLIAVIMLLLLLIPTGSDKDKKEA